MKPIRVFMLLSLAMLPAGLARAGLIYGQINYGSAIANTNRGGQSLPLNGTAFAPTPAPTWEGRSRTMATAAGSWREEPATSSTFPCRPACQHDLPRRLHLGQPQPRTYAPVPPRGITYATDKKDINGEANGTTATVTRGGTRPRGTPRSPSRRTASTATTSTPLAPT